MHKFKDKTGHEWSIELNIASARRCRDFAQADLLGPKLAETLVKLGENAELLLNTIYAIVKPEADKLGLTDEQFAERFTGEVIEAATTALEAEICLFTRSPGVRETLREISTRTRQIVETTAQGVLIKIRSGAMETAVAAELEKLETKAFGGGSASSPASPASARTSSTG